MAQSQELSRSCSGKDHSVQALEVRDLHVRFKGNMHAVRGVDFSIKEGETLGIVGESGCGKSATARALLQLHPKRGCTLTGEVLYKGANLLSFSERQMQAVRGKEIGMIFQDPMTSLNPTLRIGHQIMEGYLKHFPQASRKEARNIALETLAKVGIPDPEERFEAYPHLLSGGMRQRVMIALALVPSPRLLIADEPTTALDATIQAQILHLLKQIQQERGATLLLITHDMNVIRQMCDRVLVMYAGQIVESAPVDLLFSSPKHPYTQRLLAAIARLDHPKDLPLPLIEGSPPSLTLNFQGCSFCPRCSEAMRICTRARPPLFETGPNHLSACFKHDPRKQQ